MPYFGGYTYVAVGPVTWAQRRRMLLGANPNQREGRGKGKIPPRPKK